MDPYVKIKCGEQIGKSKTQSNAGKNPKWDDTITFKRKN